ncbi:MAG: hypothetical protein KBS52_03160 [Clostridiales bacterium]|nr:hypothetical protein [Candidatus Equinaster intestinalis]
MPSYNIADLKVNINYRYDFAEKRSEEYLIPDTDEPDFTIESTDEDFQTFIDWFKRDDCLNEFEYVIVGDKFHREVMKYDGLMFHSSCVVVDDMAYLFSADSGTGKSTHTALWLKLFGDRAYILNDDKPVIRIIDGQAYVYGTPFSGKTDLNHNRKVKIGGICFLSRGEKNEIKKISVKDALPLFMKQTFNRVDMQELETLLMVLDKVLSQVNTYSLSCNMDIEAAKVSYKGMSGKEAK